MLKLIDSESDSDDASSTRAHHPAAPTARYWRRMNFADSSSLSAASTARMRPFAYRRSSVFRPRRIISNSEDEGEGEQNNSQERPEASSQESQSRSSEAQALSQESSQNSSGARASSVAGTRGNSAAGSEGEGTQSSTEVIDGLQNPRSALPYHQRLIALRRFVDELHSMASPEGTVRTSAETHRTRSGASGNAREQDRNGRSRSHRSSRSSRKFRI